MTRSDERRHLLVAAGASITPNPFTDAELRAARARIAEAKAKIDIERATHVRRTAVIKRALPMCLALQELQLPAFVTLAILDELLPARLSDLVTMHFKWELITAIKHFHQRVSVSASQ